MADKFIPRNSLKTNNNQPKSLTGLIPKGLVLKNTNVIETTKSYFLSLVSTSSLKFPVTYKITDVDGFSGLFINTTSANTFDLNCSGDLLVPDYVAAGVNLGQMDANDIPAIADGEKIIWGDHYWLNETGAPVTPTIVDNSTLSGGLTWVYPKTAANYDVIPVDVVVNGELIPTRLYNPQNACYFDLSANYTGVLGNNVYVISQLNYQKLDNSNLTLATNFKNNQSGLISLTELNSPLSNTIGSNSAKFDNLRVVGTNNTITNNVSGGTANYTSIEVGDSCEVTGNEATGGNYNDYTCQQSFIQLFDNCRYNNNTTSGDGSYVYDIRTGENSEVIGNTFSGINSGVNDIDQMYGDSASNNTISGDFSGASQIWQNGYSKFDNHTISGNSSSFINIYQELGYLTDFTITTDNTFIARVSVISAWLKNATDINIMDFKVCGVTPTWDLTAPPSPSLIIDLAGFTTDIKGETIEAGKGWFTIEHDFSANPLTSGSSVLYNLIPDGARLTNCTIIPSSLTGGAGATLRVGLETDDVSYGLAATVLGGITNTVVNTVSNAATANRSLQLTAGVNNITGGSVTIKVEFIL